MLSLKGPVAVAGIVVALTPAPSFSQTSTANFNVQITIQAECQINSATNLNFGTSGVIDTNIDAASAIAVQCTQGVPYAISLNGGTTPGGTVAARLMAGPGGATIGYSLFTNAERTAVWDETNTVPGTGTGAEQVYPVYGRVVPQATPAAGVYQDTVTATLTY
ncbi:spore coat U domain-containing protein [Rhizobium sp. 0TCS1.26]|uniref:Csu type fimbrial protein n=1 Tax=Rhizobium sp. 0TCS1.26 TaxID=3142623 RepID=UPI003D2BA0A4